MALELYFSWNQTNFSPIYNTWPTICIIVFLIYLYCNITLRILTCFNPQRINPKKQHSSFCSLNAVKWLPTSHGTKTYTGWSKRLCAFDDSNTQNYKYCSKCLRRISVHLLTRRTLFSKTVFSLERSTFRMYSVMAISNSSIVWEFFEYTECFIVPQRKEFGHRKIRRSWRPNGFRNDSVRKHVVE
jgi:hypothetical protein